jgi:hypothetical protein
MELAYPLATRALQTGVSHDPIRLDSLANVRCRKLISKVCNDLRESSGKVRDYSVARAVSRRLRKTELSLWSVLRVNRNGDLAEGHLNDATKEEASSAQIRI